MATPPTIGRSALTRRQALPRYNSDRFYDIRAQTPDARIELIGSRWLHNKGSVMRFAARQGRQSTEITSSRAPVTEDRFSFNQAVGKALDHSDNIVMVVEARDDDFLITAVNKEAGRATGYLPEELLGRSLTSLVEADMEPGTVDKLRLAAREERAQRAELRCLTRAGKSFWFGLHMLPADIPPGGRYVVLGHDITEKLRREAQEKAVQSLLAKVFVTVDAPVYIIDLQGFIVMTNPAMDRLIGVPAGTLVGSRGADLFVPACRHALTMAREKQNVDGLDYSLDLILRLANDQEVMAHITAVMVQRSDLNRFRVVTVRVTAPLAAAQDVGEITAGGRIQLIGLDAVRESLGPRWAALKERAMASAEWVLRRRLGPHDTFSVAEESGFIVRFANISEEEAGFRAAAIGSEIRQRLIGQGESPEAAHVFAAAVALPPGKANLPAPDFAEMVKQRVGQRLRAIQETARANLARALEDTPYDAEPVYSRETSTPVGWCIRFNSATQRALDVVMAALPAAETATLDQDVMLLGFAQHCLVERALQSPGSMVFVTLSSSVLLVRKRMASCLEACNAIEENQRKQLVLTVAAPEETASRQMNNGLPRLRPFCRLLGIAVDRLEATDVDIREVGAALMLVDASSLTATSKIKARVEALYMQRCQLMVYGANRGDMARLLREGASFVSVSCESQM